MRFISGKDVRTEGAKLFLLLCSLYSVVIFPARACVPACGTQEARKRPAVLCARALSFLSLPLPLLFSLIPLSLFLFFCGTNRLHQGCLLTCSASRPSSSPRAPTSNPGVGMLGRVFEAIPKCTGGIFVGKCPAEVFGRVRYGKHPTEHSCMVRYELDTGTP